MYAATRLASPARTKPNQITQAAEIPISAEYNKLPTNVPVHKTSSHDSTTRPSVVRAAPPTTNGTATAQSVDTLASYLLKYTVPRAHASAEAVPRTTPIGERASAAPERLAGLTGKNPGNPSRSPKSLGGGSPPPRIKRKNR